VPAATSLSSSLITGKTAYGATSRRSLTFIGKTQPQGEPKGTVVSGSVHIWSQPAKESFININSKAPYKELETLAARCYFDLLKGTEQSQQVSQGDDDVCDDHHDVLVRVHYEEQGENLK
jgi:hypothetical protein